MTGGKAKKENMTGGKARKGKLFSGLRIQLVGFEEAAQNQLVEGITENGGQVSKRSDSSCTHVVVFNLPSDDSVCCAARKDGKALVTDTWITNCLEAKVLVDVKNVLYRAPKDLGGISGSENLCICLTGYQGIARKNIMRMIAIMGAKSSKPLIGSYVTHLVCYQFEGEKYELAKKMNTVLVNHFWLEDSLNYWTLLPESSYAQSGSDAEKERENVVADSGDEDSGAERAAPVRKTPSRDKVSPAVDAPSLNDKSGNPIVDEDLNSRRKPNRKSKSRNSLSPPSSDSKTRKDATPVKLIGDGSHPDGSPDKKHIGGGSDLDGSPVKHIGDGSDDIRKQEQIRTPSKPFAEFGPDGNGKGGSVPDVEDDESTRLYVEDGNESDHSCGRTSSEATKRQSDVLVDKMDVGDPVDAIDSTCQQMEMMGFAPENIAGLNASSPQDNNGAASGDDNSESPGTKRRRRSQIVDEAESLVENIGSPENEAKDCTDVVMEENDDIFSVLNHEIPSQLAVLGHDVEQDVLAASEGPGLSADELPEEMEENDPKASVSREGSAMETSSAEAEDALLDVQSAQGPPPGSSDPMEDDVADTDKPSPRERQKSTKATTTPGSGSKDKKKALKSNVNGNNARPLTFAQIARSYKPLPKLKSNQKKPAIEDKENHFANNDGQTTQKGNQKKAASGGKENLRPNEDDGTPQQKAAVRKTSESRKASGPESSKVKSFAVGGSTEDRTRLHAIIKIMGGKICRIRHQWRDEATHLILPGPLRRTEKFLAGAAAGRWILKPEYLEASKEAGKFLEEEEYEWFGEGTNDKGSISLQAPRKWRNSVAASGIGAFDGLRVIFYGECISPPLDTMKRAIKAGGGVVLASAPPYSRHIADGVNFAIIRPGISKDDPIVQEFIHHEVPCVLSEYLVDWVCHPSTSLDKYILYGTEKAAPQDNLYSSQFGMRSAQRKSGPQSQKAQEAGETEESDPLVEDIYCSVCGKLDDEEVMLLCGNDEGKGCGEGTHIYCCSPPLEKVPDEDWFCSKCQ